MGKNQKIGGMQKSKYRYMIERSFIYYQKRAKIKVKIESFGLFGILINITIFCHSALFLFGELNLLAERWVLTFSIIFYER